MSSNKDKDDDGNYLHDSRGQWAGFMDYLIAEHSYDDVDSKHMRRLQQEGTFHDAEVGNLISIEIESIWKNYVGDEGSI